MKKILALIFLILSVSLSYAQTEADPIHKDPQKLVLLYCRFDYNGARLGTGEDIDKEDAKLSHDRLVSFGVEPGWDWCVIVTSYKIYRVWQNDNEVIISVKYHVVGLASSPFVDFDPKSWVLIWHWAPDSDISTFHLVRRKDGSSIV